MSSTWISDVGALGPNDQLNEAGICQIMHQGDNLAYVLLQLDIGLVKEEDLPPNVLAKVEARRDEEAEVLSPNCYPGHPDQSVSNELAFDYTGGTPTIAATVGCHAVDWV